MDCLVRLGLNFHPIGELRGVDWASDIFLSRTDRNVTTQVVPRSVREARLKKRSQYIHTQRRRRLIQIATAQ